MRDVRGWCHTQSSRSRRTGVHAFLTWKHRNVQQMEYLNCEESDWLLVSYDELGLRPEASLRRITDFLELPYSDQMLKYGEAEHHGVHTNLKRNPDKMAGIAYDYRWIKSSSTQIPSVLLPGVMRFNREHVYGTLE